MKTARRQRVKQTLKSGSAEKLKSQRVNVSDFQLLTARLAEAEATLRAIRTGEVDAVVTAGKDGLQVFTLEGAEHAYRVLIESMNEGALTLTADKTILYANQCFAGMVKRPLEQVLGSSFRRFLADEDGAALRRLMKKGDPAGSKIQVLLIAGDGSKMPAQISLRRLARHGFNRASFGMVVTDLTEARRKEEMLRALTRRVVQAQEAERGRVALELHDHITQLLCAVLIRSQTLADKFSARNEPAKREAIKLREMLGDTAEEVERISRNLRPSILDELGLVALMRDVSMDFTERTGVSLRLTSLQLAARLPGDVELTLYRILQETLKNVERHARAGHVTVCLKLPGADVELVIRDDGIGFDPEHLPGRRAGNRGLGLLGMRERATAVGGKLSIASKRGTGTKITLLVPLPTRTPVAS